MQRIISLFVRYKNLILYLLLLSLSTVFLGNRSYYHQTQLNKISLGISGGIYQVGSLVTSYFALKQKVDQLVEENKALKKLTLSYFEQTFLSNNASQSNFPFEVKKAQVIKNSHQLARNYLVINQGSNDGIQPEMGVINANGIVGIVNQVTANYASVISILNNEIRINARFKNNTSFGSLRWDGTNPKEMLLDDIVSIYPVNVGDTIISGGMSAYFPLGIPIGKIVDVKTPLTQGYHEIKVSLFNDPTQFNFVYVIENLNYDEIKTLIDKEEK